MKKKEPSWIFIDEGIAGARDIKSFGHFEALCNPAGKTSLAATQLAIKGNNRPVCQVSA